MYTMFIVSPFRFLIALARHVGRWHQPGILLQWRGAETSVDWATGGHWGKWFHWFQGENSRPNHYSLVYIYSIYSLYASDLHDLLGLRLLTFQNLLSLEDGFTNIHNALQLGCHTRKH